MRGSNSKVVCKPHKHIYVDTADLFRMRFVNHLTYDEIAKHFQCSKQNVRQRLMKFVAKLPSELQTKIYETNKVKVLSLAELTLLKELFDTKKLNKASINNLAYAFAQIFTARRLEAGQATENISYADLTKQKQELLAAIEEYQKRAPQDIVYGAEKVSKKSEKTFSAPQDIVFEPDNVLNNCAKIEKNE